LDLSEDSEFFPPRWVNWPNLACFASKVVAVIVAYAFLLRFVWGALRAGSG
jgi:hypothetical protein